MANFKYFADTHKGTLEFDRVDYRATGAYGYDQDNGVWVRTNRKVEYKSNPSRHECDSRCRHATGRVMKCECSCGGKNHGKG